MQSVMANIGIGASVLLAISLIADRRRNARKDLDKVGFMPWPLITVVATLVAAVSIGLALKS